MCECDEEISGGGDEMSFWVRQRKRGAVHRFIIEAGQDEGEATRGAMRSRKARSRGRRTGREAVRRAREAVAWEATTGWGKERRAEAASWAAAGRGAGRESRWQKKAATAWRCRAEEDAMVLRWPA
jgi:hypothetical protein